MDGRILFRRAWVKSGSDLTGLKGADWNIYERRTSSNIVIAIIWFVTIDYSGRCKTRCIVTKVLFIVCSNYRINPFWVNISSRKKRSSSPNTSLKVHRHDGRTDGRVSTPWRVKNVHYNPKYKINV